MSEQIKQYKLRGRDLPIIAIEFLPDVVVSAKDHDAALAAKEARIAELEESLHTAARLCTSEAPGTGDWLYDDRDDLATAIEALSSGQKADVGVFVDRFLSWPLPKTVRPDDCVMDPSYPHRYGTNLLSAAEAKSMFEHALAAQQQAEPATHSEEGRETLSDAEQIAFVLRQIGSLDADDITGDDVDLRFEDANGRDTGCDVSIVEYAEKAADLIDQHSRIVAAKDAEIARITVERNRLIGNSRGVFKDMAEMALKQRDELAKELAELRAQPARQVGVVLPRPCDDPDLSAWHAGYNEALVHVADLNRRAIPAGLLERICKPGITLPELDSAVDELRALLGK